MALVSLSPLLSKTQNTLAQPTEWLHGATLRNYPASIRFVPAKANTGRIIRVYHQDRLLEEFPVALHTGRVGYTWTDACNPVTDRAVGVIEHPGGALVLAGIDNVIIEVNYPHAMPYTRFYGNNLCTSVPLLDGTARSYLEVIARAGLQPQKEPRQWLTVTQPHEFTFGESRFRIEPRAEPGWSVTLTMDMNNSWWRTSQLKEHSYDLNSPDAEDVLSEIASSRASNYTYRDWLLFRALTLGCNRKADFVAFHGPFHKTPLDGQPAYGNRETIMHRHFDLIGDTMFFSGYLQVNLIVHGGVHDDTHPFRMQTDAEDVFSLLPLAA